MSLDSMLLIRCEKEKLTYFKSYCARKGLRYQCVIRNFIEEMPSQNYKKIIGDLHERSK